MQTNKNIYFCNEIYNAGRIDRSQLHSEAIADNHWRSRFNSLTPHEAIGVSLPCENGLKGFGEGVLYRPYCEKFSPQSYSFIDRKLVNQNLISAGQE